MTRVASTSALNLTRKLQEAGIRHPGLLQVVAKTPESCFLMVPWRTRLMKTPPYP